MAERNVLNEAQHWYARLQKKGNPLAARFDYLEITDGLLEDAYLEWWKVYSAGIRNAPSNRKGQGVSGEDARAAANAADKATMKLVEAYSDR